MIDPTRLADLDALLDRATQTIPTKVYALRQAFIAAGFVADGTPNTLTIEILKALLAVPAQPELPQPQQQ